MRRQAIGAAQASLLLPVSGGWAIVYVGAVAAGLVAIALAGWAVSSLHVLAGWTDDASRAQKLEITKGILASLSAGGLGAYAAIENGVPAVGVVLLTFFGGYSGERWLRPLSEGLLARIQAAITAVVGGRPPEGKP